MEQHRINYRTTYNFRTTYSYNPLVINYNAINPIIIEILLVVLVVVAARAGPGLSSDSECRVSNIIPS